MENIFEELSLKLNQDCMKGKKLENGKRLLTEALVGKINPNLGVYIFPREHEIPHFLVSTPDKQTCRFSLETGEPMDDMPRDIKKYRYNIRDFFRDNKQMLVDEYRKLRPDDAPPQSKI